MHVLNRSVRSQTEPGSLEPNTFRRLSIRYCGGCPGVVEVTGSPGRAKGSNSSDERHKALQTSIRTMSSGTERGVLLLYTAHLRIFA